MIDEFHTLQKFNSTPISTTEFKVVVVQSSTDTEDARKSKSLEVEYKGMCKRKAR